MHAKLEECWRELQLHPQVLEALLKFGYERPTLVQRLAIPRILKTRRHVLIMAPTGSGKTEAAMLPILSRVLEQGVVDGRTYVIYVTPLRALNRDLLKRMERLCGFLGLRIGVIHGDTPQHQRRRYKVKPPHIIITTPESLQYILVSESYRKALSELRYVIVDEAQEVPTSKRGAELVVALERLRIYTRRGFQRVALSAAYSDPRELAEFIFGPMRPYEVVDVTQQKRITLHVDGGGEGGGYVEGLSEGDIAMGLDILIDVLREVLKSARQVLVFVNTRDTAEYLGVKLSQALGVPIGVHHGSLSRSVRERIEEEFKRGELRVLVATSSLELGIDIGGVDVVVQFNSPRQALRLIQRVGRSGHREGESSRGVVIAPRSLVEAVESMVIARRTLALQLEKEPVVTNPLDVLVHQVVGIALERGRVGIEEIYALLRRSAPFAYLTMEELEKVIDFANSIGLVRRSGDEITPTVRGRIYYYTTTMIVEGRQFIARSAVSGDKVANLDEEFVATIADGDTVVLSGRLWNVVGVDEEQGVVYVEPITRIENARLPKWVGEMIPVSLKVAREVCSVFRRLAGAPSEKEAEKILSMYPVSDRLRKWIIEGVMSIVRKGYGVPDDRKVVAEIWRRGSRTIAVIYTCLGSRGSEAFAQLLADMIQEEFGVAVAFKSFPIAMVVEVDRVLHPEALSALIEKIATLSDEELYLRAVRAVKKTPMFKWRVLAVAKRMGIVSKDTSLRELRRVYKVLKGTIVEEEAIREAMRDKLDILGLKEYLRRISRTKGTLRIEVRVVPQSSPLAQELLAISGLSERFVQSSLPMKTILELVKRRILSKRVKLVCLMCGTVHEYVLRELPEWPTCSHCGSRFLALVRRDDDVRLVKKMLSLLRRKGSIEPTDLSDDEKRRMRELRKEADLILSYGKRAVVALEARGVGPETAKRILSIAQGYDDLFRLIYEAERNYIRTRRYWH